MEGECQGRRVIIPSRQVGGAPIYSALEHLAKALFVGRWKESSWAFMSVSDYFIAYFDETRVDDDSPFPVVAGFCNPYDVWEFLEKKWKEASANIPEREVKKYFRYRPSDNHTLEDERRYRDSLILAKVIRDFTLWPIHVSIEKQFFQPTIDSVDKSSNPLLRSAYTVCSFYCCELLDDLAIQHKFKREHGLIKVVFDKGHADARWLEKGYKQYYSQKQNTYLKKTPLFEDDEDLIPLRAADAYAWLLGRKYNLGEELEQLNIIHNKHNVYHRRELVITREKASKILEMVNSDDEDTATKDEASK
jgi:hypothetical protein